MRIKQYFLGCLSHASYLITDDKSHTAAVIDPQRDIRQYLDDAEAAGCAIRHVFLTHFHADFLAGHIELRDKAGATIYLGRRGSPEYTVTPIGDGSRIEFGDVRLDILETPGHTPEGISIVAYDLQKDAARPQAVFTGDTLFIGDVGRPDLLVSVGVSADDLAGMLHDSLHNKLMLLPEATLVYPAHGAGSMCGRNLSTETVSTIGEQKKFNYALQPMTLAEFKAIVTAEQPEAPSYFAKDAVLNRKERPSLESTLSREMKGLDLNEVLTLRDRGAQILDVRDAIDFEASHLTGATNIGIQGKFATWSGTVLDAVKPIAVIADPGREEEAILRLGRIGFDNVAGYLRGGMEALDRRPDLVSRIDRITAVALYTLEPKPLIIDVRGDKEFKAGHIPNSTNIPLNHLRDSIGKLPQDRLLVVHCEGGYRSAIAASLLEQAGHRSLMDLVGGFKAWTTSKLPVLVEP